MGDSADMGRLKLARKRDPILNKRLVNIQRAGISAAAGRGDISPARARQQMLDLGIHPTLKKAPRGKGDDWINKLVFQSGLGLPRMIGSTINTVAHPKQAAKGIVESVKHPRRAVETAVRENPGDLLFGALVGGLAAGPKSAILNVNRGAKIAARSPKYDPMASGPESLRPTIPVKGKPGWSLERQLGSDTHRQPGFITYKGRPFKMDPYDTDQVAYNLVGPSLTKKKGKAVYGSVTGEPKSPGARTKLGEIYVSDQARKALGPFAGAEALVDAIWRGGGKRPIQTIFANQQLGKFARISEKRGKPWFKGVTDEEFSGMGAEGLTSESRWLWDPDGDPNDMHNWNFDPYDYVDPDTGSVLPGWGDMDLPDPLYRQVFGRNKPQNAETRGFGGTRGAGHLYLPDTVIEEVPRLQALQEFLRKRR